ncbi:hypothetical protein R6Q57_020140 [Mikania cordata]
MPSSFTIHVLLFVLFVQMVIGADPLYYFCSTTSGNFKPYGPYDQSLNKLLGNLYYQTPSNGFGMASAGQYQAQTFGLSLCRGDMSAEDCKSCVVNASAGIRERCPNNKAATIWDLSSGACKTFLDDAINILPSCCDGKEGGRVVGGSCNIRYEIYSFVNA